MRVLVIDDTPVVSAVITQMLQLNNHTVVEITENFTDLLKYDLPIWAETDVVVCDINLPGISGLDIIQMLKYIYPNIYRIIITGAYTEKLIIPDADKVIHKPQDVIEIVTIVDALEREQYDG